jgi:hypothetical protein
MPNDCFCISAAALTNNAVTHPRLHEVKASGYTSNYIGFPFCDSQGTNMAFPDFYEQVPNLTLRDPLADVLGAAADGIFEYRYIDAVKLAGHSCPTVAGAWLMASRELTALYRDSTRLGHAGFVEPQERQRLRCLPERGNIHVELRATQNAGTTGVVGAVLGLITGAAGDGGFKGIAGRYVRRDLLMFGVDIDADVRITRLDTGAAVLIDYNPDAVPPSPDMPPLMARVVGGVADDQERAQFARLWQDRVRRILLQHAADPALLAIRTVA